MKTTVFIFLLSLCSASAFGQNTDSFIVEVNDRNIRVTSPLKKTKIVSIIVKNNTFDKIVSELRVGKKVIKRFVLFSKGKEVVQVNYSKAKGKGLSYVPISPPFESAQLRFEQKAYEIPEKK